MTGRMEFLPRFRGALPLPPLRRTNSIPDSHPRLLGHNGCTVPPPRQLKACEPPTALRIFQGTHDTPPHQQTGDRLAAGHDGNHIVRHYLFRNQGESGGSNLSIHPDASSSDHVHRHGLPQIPCTLSHGENHPRHRDNHPCLSCHLLAIIRPANHLIHCRPPSRDPHLPLGYRPGALLVLPQPLRMELVPSRTNSTNLPHRAACYSDHRPIPDTLYPGRMRISPRCQVRPSARYFPYHRDSWANE